MSMISRKISGEIRVVLARKNLRIQRLRARVTVLTEDLEIAEGEAGRAQESATTATAWSCPATG